MKSPLSFGRYEFLTLSSLGTFLLVSFLFFIFRHFPSAPGIIMALPRMPFLLAIPVSVLLLAAGVSFFTPFRPFTVWMTKFLVFSAPTTLFITALRSISEYTPETVEMIASLYVFAVLAVIFRHLFLRSRTDLHDPGTDEPGIATWFRRQGPVRVLAVLALTGTFFGYAVHDLGKFAAVDEALWLYDRIPKYWKAVSAHDPSKTNISDKPGITVAMASGAGLLRYPTPKAWDGISGSMYGIDDFFAAYRFPIVVVATVFLPLFYYLLERLAGPRKALLAYGFLALAPPTVGMTGIINPDSFLWLFTPLSFLAFLAYRKRRHFGFLFLSGILLGLALLTKYIANILFVFILGALFLEYILRREKGPFLPFLRTALTEYALWTFIALSVFFVLFPITWLKPEKLLDATILSQAFEKISILFVFLFAAIVVDRFGNRARISESLMGFLRRYRTHVVTVISAVWISLILFVVGNVWSGMSWFDFPSLLASPKNIGAATGFFGAFSANAYPLVFGVIPLSFAMLFVAPICVLRKDAAGTSSGKTILYGILFILLYYLGTTINGVGAMTRYQIILFPMAAIISGFALDSLLNFLEKHVPFPGRIRPLLYPATFLVVVIPGIVTLANTPFPLSYASPLLPTAYATDVKDMGPGSYEAAEYLNTLPDAESLRVWTDKDGVCKFFDGSCGNSFDWDRYEAEGGFDYIVVSSGRESRTTSRVMNGLKGIRDNVIRFDTYYGKENPDWELLINGRPSHYVKIYRFER